MLKGELVVLPPGPRCDRCGHVVCPCCLDWCDELTDDGLCCDGLCIVNEHAVDAWQRDCRTLATLGKLVVIAEGPCQWG